MSFTVTEGDHAMFLRGGNDPEPATILCVCRKSESVVVMRENGEIELATLEQICRRVEPVESDALSWETRAVIVELAKVGEHLLQGQFALEFVSGEREHNYRNQIGVMRESVRDLATFIARSGDVESQIDKRFRERVMNSCCAAAPSGHDASRPIDR